MRKRGPVSRTTRYLRTREAKALGCDVEQLPDKRGSNTKACGQNHGRWNTGKIVSSGGYPKIRVGKEHPLADPNGYAYEHLLVWVSGGKQA